MNKIAIYLVCIAIAVTGIFYLHKHQVDKAVTAAYAQVENEHNKRLIALMNKADAESLVLKATIKEQQNETKTAIADINKRYSIVIAGLQQRPERPTGKSDNTSSTGTTESTVGAYPAELFREDSQDIAAVGKAADELKEYLLQCYKQYDEVKDAIERFNK